MFERRGVLALIVATILMSPLARAASVPFSESYAANASGWLNNASGSLTYTASGGQDGGGFVSTEFNFVGQTAGGQGPVLFRGNASASGGAFVGNWLTDGVGTFSAWVRHDADVPLNYFARFVAPAGFPGAIAIDFTPVAASSGPDGWTRIQFAITPGPHFASFEGSDFNTIFASIGRVQIGVSVPTGLAGVDKVVHFDLDTVGIAGATPEPAGLGLLLLSAAAVAVLRRARQASPA